jgi:hypothetical protein
LTDEAVFAVLSEPKGTAPSGASVITSGRRLDFYDAYPMPPLLVYFDEDGLVESTELAAPPPVSD